MWYGIYQSRCQTNVLSCILGTAWPYGSGDVSFFFFFPWLTSCVERSPYCELRFIFFLQKEGRRKACNIHMALRFFCFQSCRATWKPATTVVLWLKVGWQMLMPRLCFHSELLLGGALSFDFLMHGIVRCEPPRCAFLPSDASPSTYLWAIIWGRGWMFILAEIPSCIHAYFLWPEKWPWVSCYTRLKRAGMHIQHTRCPQRSPQQFVLLLIRALVETFLVLFYRILMAPSH